MYEAADGTSRAASARRVELFAAFIGAAPDRVADVVETLEDDLLNRSVCAVEGSRELLTRLREAGVRTARICDTGFSPGRVVRQMLARGAIHVGDIRRTDVAGALAAGMGAIRFRGRHDDGHSAREPARTRTRAARSASPIASGNSCS